MKEVRRQDSHAVLERVERTIVALGQTLDRSIRIHRDGQPCALRPRRFEIGNMAAMQKIENAVRAGVHTDHLAEFGTVPDVNAYGPFNVNRVARVRHIGTGKLLVQKKVFRDLAEKHPEWKYRVKTSYFFGQPNPDREFQFDFFQNQNRPGDEELCLRRSVFQ